MTAEGRMPCLARDPPHAISIFLYSREQKANITDLDYSFLKSDAKVLLLFHTYNTLSAINAKKIKKVKKTLKNMTYLLKVLYI